MLEIFAGSCFKGWDISVYVQLFLIRIPVDLNGHRIDWNSYRRYMLDAVSKDEMSVYKQLFLIQNSCCPKYISRVG